MRRMRFRFLSTPSGRRATFIFSKKYFYVLFLSTPSGRRATLTSLSISRQVTISIHALRVEGDGHVVLVDGFGKLFLSTPSGWRATIKLLARCYNPNEFLSTPSGWRATVVFAAPGSYWPISIHALRVEGDNHHQRRRKPPCNFYPRPPGGGRQICAMLLWALHEISIHALRVEGDPRRFCYAGGADDFYPRPPGGGRQQKRTKFSSVFAQKGEEFASLRRGKREFAGGVLKRTNFGF